MYENGKEANVDGKVYVENNKIIVKDPIGRGETPIIIPPLEGTIYIDGKIINKPFRVKEENVIEFKELKVEYKRNINLSWNKDSTEGYISINYENEKKYILKDMKESKSLSLEVIEVEGEIPPNISEEEIMLELKKAKIIYGINEENIKQIINSQEIKNVLIAKGKTPKPPIEDEIKILFNRTAKDYEKNEKVDHRSFNTITSVKANEILAEIIKGEDGIDGINIFNDIIPSKPKKKSNFSAGNGTKLENNLIISTIDGKPNFSKNKVWIEPVYVLNKDVTMSTGNIIFPANVEINGKVTEGMKVTSGESLVINGGVFSGEIEAKNSTEIVGNVINSKIKIGGNNLVKSNRINTLKELREILDSIVLNLDYLKENNLIREEISIGLLIKLLIEKKFKSTSKILIKVISNSVKDYCKNSEVVKLVKSKLLGASVSNIKEISEIKEIIYKIDEELLELEADVLIEATLRMEYAQESKIDVVGNIDIYGKGLFTSELNATKSIIFTTENGICRGGYLKADELIKASIVGSDSGVFTNLEVGRYGNIYVNIAYPNTTFIIGNKKYILDKASKNIHVYIDKDGSLEVEKLIL
ncbi:flagellar assembly protein A [Clostridium sp. AL.422]|uniref:DUF342 domain-containing protein n=1 Tax=Clostridium TaxID=1485 RepID=UPI00293DE0D3|nr:MULTISPECIES: flagellar assembly protein A [unclassified Clostridium]MDV4149739.1 flagellar assembly protein A [Clostridium sp. AL.422]